MFAKLKSLMQKLTGTKTQAVDIKMPSDLSPAKQKQVREIVDRARGDRTVPHSTQESIPFQRMFPDGICRTGDNNYTKTIRFDDINYTQSCTDAA